MKKFSLIFSFVLAAFMVFGQDPNDPQDLQKMQAERDAQLREQSLQMFSMDKAPIGHSDFNPGYVQTGFKDGDILAYAWNAYGGSIAVGPCTVLLPSGALTSIAASDIDFIAGADWANETWYGVQYAAAGNGPLVTINTTTGDVTLIGGGAPNLTGLGYDVTSETMYAMDFDGTLYTIDLSTGATTNVGLSGVPNVIGIACGTDGVLYAISLDDNLYTVNTSTAAGTLVGPLGVTINYAQDIAYDRENEILYGALYTSSGGLYTINTSTGAATLVNNFVSEVTGFAIPYTLADPAAPEAPTSFYAVPADLGVVYADIFWTNPSKTVGGDDLTELTSIALYLSGEDDPIYVNNTPEIGGIETFEFTGTDEGLYSFTVFGTNTAGQGLSAKLNVWLGHDVPAAPSNVVLTAVGNDGHVTWIAPTAGLNGGYIEPANTTYTVVRMPGAVVLAEDIDVTEYTDDAVPGIGNYYYAVTASNDLGVGGTANSNVALLGAEGILLYEPFDGIAVGQLPAGWSVMGVGSGNWGVQNTTSAGGTAPEMRLYWSPSFNGLSRLITYPINTGGNTDLRLKLKNFLSNYAVVGNTIAIQASFDDGENWENIWFYDITASLPAQDLELYFTVPEGVTTMHLGWEFEGDAYQINNWNFDNIVLEPVLENDLVAVSISGNTTPSVGMETTYTITVQNAGTATQTDYIVKLMREGGIELASAEGEPIEFAETIEYEMVWTPEEEDEGPTYVYGYVEFAEDELMGNNQTANLNLNIQGGDIVVITIGTGSSLQYIPYNFYYDYSLSQTLYLADEIGMGGGVITGIQYTNSFNAALEDKNIQIWMGETDASDLSTGWVDPSSLELVFDGTVDFPIGENSIFIPLDDIYIYGGGNLVIYSYKPDDEWSSGKNFFNSEGAGRTRRAYQDGSPYDPTAPPAGSVANFFPNISIYFSTAGLGALEGTVTDGTDPIEGALVWVMGTNTKTYTDEDGFYSFPYLIAGTYDIEFSLFGYDTHVEEDVVIEEDITTELDITLIAIPQYTVTGTVVGNDGLDIAGAAITLEGYDDYATVTNVDGEFTIMGVYQGTYQLSITAVGYQAYTDEIEVDSDTDIDITLTEIIVAPFGLLIETEGMGAGEALFSWNNVFGTELFEDFEGGTVPSDWTRIINSTDQSGPSPATWTVTSYSSETFGPIGSYHVGLWWSYNHQDEWLITPEVTIGPNYELEFWSAVFLGSTNGDHYYVKISTDGGTNWTVLWDASALTGEWNYYTSPFVIDLTAYNGEDVHFAFHAEDPPSNDGLWYIWFIDNVAVGPEGARNTLALADFYRFSAKDQDNNSDIADAISKDGSTWVMPGIPAKAKSFIGFNVYLNDELVTEDPIMETEYLFEDLPAGEHVAGVQSVYSTGESAIITIDFEIESIVEKFSVTFNVDMTNADFDPEEDVVYMTGSMLEWAEPGTLPEDQTMTQVGETMIWTMTIELEAGEYQYKYFLNDGWDGGEWTGDPNRVVTIVDADVVVDDIWGFTNAPTNLLSNLHVYPNPFSNFISVVNAEMVTRVVVTNIIGQVVMDMPMNGSQQTIETGNLNKGVYLITFMANNGERVVRKMVKQ